MVKEVLTTVDSKTPRWASRHEVLRHVIASLPANATMDEVCKAMDPILDECGMPVEDLENNTELPLSEDHGITPLMLACDKAQKHCLRYMVKKLDLDIGYYDLWGRPSDVASSEYGNNSAIHFAARAGCLESVILLIDMIKGLVPKTLPTRQEIVELLSHRNGHNDTPIMMASADGQIDFLKFVADFLESAHSAEGATNDEFRSCLQSLFQLTNDSGDSALSVTFGYGHVAVVDFLLRSPDGPRLPLTYEEVQTYKAGLETVDMSFLRASSSLPDEYRVRRNDMKRCMEIVDLTLAEQAEAYMHSLLLSSGNGEEHDSESNARIPKKKRSQKHKTRRKKGGSTCLKSEQSMPRDQVHHDDELPENDHEAKTTRNYIESDTSNQLSMASENVLTLQGSTVPPIDPLQDGTAASNGAELESGVIHRKSSKYSAMRGAIPAVDAMLRERYRDPIPYRNDMDSDLSIDAMMDSLCLEASMLLLSPHGMAMNLSPSQLDAVAGILSKQVDAVQEAKTIQTRLRSTLKL